MKKHFYKFLHSSTPANRYTTQLNYKADQLWKIGVSFAILLIFVCNLYTIIVVFSFIRLPKLEIFLDLMRPLQLGGKLACLLIQLPPKYSYNPDNHEAFFQLLDPMFRYAVEFRNKTWLLPETKTFSLLERYNVAYTIVDEPLLPPEVHIPADFAYFRWHGHGENIWFDYRYTQEELEPWVQKVEQTAVKVKKVYGYFNNHYHGYAPENCLQLIERLGLLTEEQKKAKFKTAVKQAQLGAFFS